MRHSACIFIVLLTCFSFPLKAQLPPIDSVRNKYLDWLTGEGVNYSTYEVNQRYIRFLSSGMAAKNLSAYNFSNPGAAWDLSLAADRSIYSQLVEQKLIRLVFLYKIKGPASSSNPSYHSITLRDTILQIFDYMKAKGINSTTNFNVYVNPPLEGLEIYNSVALRSSAYATSVLLMKAELQTHGEWTHHMGALANLTSFIDPSNPSYNFTYPGFNTDVIRSTLQQRLCYILAQDNSSNTRIADMAYLRNFINNSLLPANGWSDCIKPDLTTYHHRGAYMNSYGMNALHVSSIFCRILAGTSYALSPAAKQNLVDAVFNYRRFCNDFEMPRAVAGRFPSSTDAYNELRPALAYLYTADPIAYHDAGREFVRLWAISPSANQILHNANISSIVMVHTMGGIQDIVNVLNAGLTPAQEIAAGQFNFPYAGLSVHKYNGHQVSVKGTSRYIWHYESSANENVFGRYTSAGAMEILALGNPVTHAANGLSLTGVDWAHVPGATAAYLPDAVLGIGTMRQPCNSEFLAHAALDSNGVFAMDYRDINSSTSMSALKTVFFFKDKLLCLGSTIHDLNGTSPIHTTLFQTAIPSFSSTAYVNGNPVSGTTYTHSQVGGGLWATDETGNGYVLPGGLANTASVTVEREVHTSMNQANTATLTGNFSSAYIDHGTAPSSGKYCYAVAIQGGSAGTASLAANFNAVFQVLKQDSLAHVVKYVPDSVYNYAVWDTSAVFSADAVRRVNKPSVIMSQQLPGDLLKLSLTYADLGFLDAGEYYNYGQWGSSASRLYRPGQYDTVTLTLQGKWLPVTPMANVMLSQLGNTTRVAFACINGFTIQTLLKKDLPLTVGVQSWEAGEQSLLLYPNPTEAMLIVRSMQQTIQSLSVTDLTGKDLTGRVTLSGSSQEKLIDMGSLSPGMYFVKVNNSTYKVIRQ